jgi:hypothetical protein
VSAGGHTGAIAAIQGLRVDARGIALAGLEVLAGARDQLLHRLVAGIRGAARRDVARSRAAALAAH